MIKVKVDSLPPIGFDFKQELPADSLNERLLEAPDSAANKVEFQQPVKVDIHVERVPQGMTAEGSISAICSQLCSLCAENVEHEVACAMRHVFKHHTNTNEPLPEEDIGVSYYEGDHVEMKDVLEDILITNLSPYWHPPTDATGICTHCKTNTSDKKTKIKLGTQGLGEALKKAGIQ